MRVLIILALVGAAFSELIAAPPLGLSSVVVESTKPRYEYSSSVQTPSYNNFAYVRSGDNIARTVVAAPVVAGVEPKPTLIAARSDLPYYPSPYYASPYYASPYLASPYLASNYIGSPYIRSAAIPTSNIVYRSDLGPWSSTRLLPLGERFVVRAAEPAVLPAAIPATPANIVQTIVEPKIVGAAVLERKSQYHSQNELGEATYGHREPFQSHDAVQDAFGNKFGSFSYLAADGRILQTDYTADANGYRVKSNALPVAESAKTIVRRRRSVPADDEVKESKVEEVVAKAEVDDKAPVEKRSIGLLAPSLYRTVPVAPWSYPLTRTWAAPNVHSFVQSPLTYSSYIGSPWYGSPFRSSYPYVW